MPVRIAPEKVLPAAAAALIFLSVAALFSGCYVLKQGGTMLGYHGRAVPIDGLADDPAVPEEVRSFAGRVLDIRRFAVRELGLRENSNYTRYVELDRDFLASVVSATARDAFDRHEWWFPVVGRVPYKGFFKEKDARREAEKLKARDLDVWVRRVDAFSTLGWFSDPLYSYMSGYPVHRLADLLIHEQTHATVFLKNRVQFNEELAEFVGREGARLYIEKTYGRDSEENRDRENAEADGAAFIAFIGELIAELENLYGSDAGREEKLRRKDEIILDAQTRFADGYDRIFRGGGYRGFSRLRINNAYLELFRLYHGSVGYFEGLYARTGRDLARIVAAAESLKGRKGEPKQLLEEALGLR